MKQFLAFIAAGILALIALGSLAGIVGFAIRQELYIGAINHLCELNHFWKVSLGYCWFNRFIHCTFSFASINRYRCFSGFILRIP